MKKVTILISLIALCMAFVGCEKKTTISLPFDVADVNNVEMYHYIVQDSIEKKTVTETDDINELYDIFSGLEVSDKETEPVNGGDVISFRFNLSDETDYEIIYWNQAVKTGRLIIPSEQLDYCSTADIVGYWDAYEYEAIPVDESELP